MTLFNGSYQEYRRPAGQAEYAREAVKFSVPENENSKTGFQLGWPTDDGAVTAKLKTIDTNPEANFKCPINGANVDIGGGGNGFWLLVTGHYNNQLLLLFCHRGSSRKRWDTWWSGWSFVWSGTVLGPNSALKSICVYRFELSCNTAVILWRSTGNC
ncbi:hypothetical protein C8J57DRAFT_1244032 [Mycena rebaudengoi]|nr:hypothetical protein C8J57DRAFT_1244032 [Mycena rebaudengoi]